MTDTVVDNFDMALNNSNCNLQKNPETMGEIVTIFPRFDCMAEAYSQQGVFYFPNKSTEIWGKHVHHNFLEPKATSSQCLF